MIRDSIPVMTARRTMLALACLVAAVLPVRTADAQARWVPRLQLDNDVYNLWQRHTRRPDEQYTNGVRASLEATDGSWWGGLLARSTGDCRTAGPGEACRSTRLTLGQDLYTPNLDRAPFAFPDWEKERPYFAWLHVTTEALVAAPRSLSTVQLSIGVTGPPAGGQVAQRIAHEIGFNDLATGWETQIGFEPGLALEYRRAQLVWRSASDRGVGFDLAPELALSAGNIRTHAELGGEARIGWNLSHPWSPAEWGGRAAREVWLSAGGRVMRVVRDMSLDGTLRRPARQVERTPDVAQYELGIGVRLKWFAVTYQAVTRSREYRTGPAHHAHGALSAWISLAGRGR